MWFFEGQHVGRHREWRICKDMKQIYTCGQVEAVFVIFWFVNLFSVVVAPKNEVFLYECRNPYINIPLMTPLSASGHIINILAHFVQH